MGRIRRRHVDRLGTMKFSLILTTKGRVSEIDRLFQSLAAQTVQDFQIIVSDQNDDDRVGELIRKWDWKDRLIHVKSSGGASAGRNRGLDLAQGELIGFPDDDCSFPPELLNRVSLFFEDHPEFGVLSGRSVAEDGGDGASRHSSQASVIKKLSIFTQCIEFTLFARRAELGAMRFDENLGVGCSTPWQADEGPDLLLRLQDQGVQSYYDPQYTIWHPRPVPNYDAKSMDRVYRYACGTGYFLRKHRYPLWYFVYRLAKMFCGAVVFHLLLKPGKAREYLVRIRGQYRGWTEMPRSSQASSLHPSSQPQPTTSA
jgi:glycosyltransferase involved in cell wall biosynthesis